MFELFREGYDRCLTAGLEHCLAALIAEPAVAQQAALGTRAIPRHTKPQCHGTFKIGDDPELATWRGRLGPKALTRGVLMEGGTDAVALVERQRGAIAADPSIDKPAETSSAILSAPLH